MDRFNNPGLVFSEDGGSASLLDQLTYSHPLGTIKVPSGFDTDFASVPRFFQRLLPKLDRHIRAAVVHDWLYFKGLTSRVCADVIFLDAMRDLGVPWWKRTAMFVALRAFGWTAWNAHRRRQSAAL